MFTFPSQLEQLLKEKMVKIAMARIEIRFNMDDGFDPQLPKMMPKRFFHLGISRKLGDVTLC
jgi:hypothetical protein